MENRFYERPTDVLDEKFEFNFNVACHHFVDDVIWDCKKDVRERIAGACNMLVLGWWGPIVEAGVAIQNALDNMKQLQKECDIYSASEIIMRFTYPPGAEVSIVELGDVINFRKKFHPATEFCWGYHNYFKSNIKIMKVQIIALNVNVR